MSRSSPSVIVAPLSESPFSVSARKKAPCCAFTDGVSSDMISRETVCRSRWPCISAEMRARFVFSQSC